MSTTSAPIPGYRCEVCLGPITDDDCKHNYIDHPHDGYWCDGCLEAYTLPRVQAIALLKSRRDPKSWLAISES